MKKDTEGLTKWQIDLAKAVGMPDENIARIPRNRGVTARQMVRHTAMVYGQDVFKKDLTGETVSPGSALKGRVSLMLIRHEQERRE